MFLFYTPKHAVTWRHAVIDKESVMEKMEAHRIMHERCITMMRKYEVTEAPPISSEERIAALRLLRGSRSLITWFTPVTRYEKRLRYVDSIGFAISRGMIPKDEAFDIVQRRTEFVTNDSERDQRLFSRCDFVKNILYGLPGDEELAKKMGFGFQYCY
jgi:hypothetical protein